MSNLRRRAIRTVRNGQVRIGGVTYLPDHRYLAYDGRLDGQRFLFGRYPKPGHPGEWEPMVCLWGTEAAARGTEDPNNGPHVADGLFPWNFWFAEGRNPHA